MKNLFIVDAHEDIAYHLSYFRRDFISPQIPCQITLPWLKQGGIGLVFNTIYVPAEFKPHRTTEVALSQLAIYDEIYKTHGDDVFQVRSVGDLARFGGGKIGFLTLMEGADAIPEPEHLGEFYRRGVRIIGLAWNDRNQYASGNNTDSGLSDAGRELIREMNRLRITLDLSHLNERGFWEAINETSLAPIASHSNARSVCDHPRNLRDEQILAVSKRGGVVGLVLYNYFIKKGGESPALEDIFIHADYIINLCGEDHLGIGSDLDGADARDFPKEIQTVADIPKIARYFLDRGYSEGRVRKIMGGNFLRVLRENL
ncbi:MAG: dipeptidase [Deltaproteobacteria bacterium]